MHRRKSPAATEREPFVPQMPPEATVNALPAVAQAPTGPGTGTEGIVTAAGIAAAIAREAEASLTEVVVTGAGSSRTGRAGTAGSTRAAGVQTAAAAATQETRLAAATGVSRLYTCAESSPVAVTACVADWLGRASTRRQTRIGKNREYDSHMQADAAWIADGRPMLPRYPRPLHAGTAHSGAEATAVHRVTPLGCQLLQPRLSLASL